MGKVLDGVVACAYGVGSLVVSVFWILSIIERGVFDDHTLILWALGLAMGAYAANKARRLGWERG